LGQSVLLLLCSMVHRPDLPPSDPAQPETFEPETGDRLNIESIRVFKLSPSGFSFKKLPLLDQKKNPTLLGHLLLSASLISGFWIGDSLASHFAAQKQKQWLAVPDPRVKVVPGNSNLYTYSPNNLIQQLLANYQATEKGKSVQEKEVLKIYYLNLTARRFVHADVLSYCYVRTFVTITLVTFATLLASICLFFISRVGWERANNTLINLFLVCASVVAVYGGLALGLNYDKNVKENEKLYVAYTNLENETLNFLATGRAKDGQPVSSSDFLVYLAQRLEELSAISLDFNTSEVLRSRENIMKTINSNNAQPEPHQ
jgi:hypothetical protein